MLVKVAFIGTVALTTLGAAAVAIHTIVAPDGQTAAWISVKFAASSAVFVQGTLTLLALSRHDSDLLRAVEIGAIPILALGCLGFLHSLYIAAFGPEPEWWVTMLTFLLVAQVVYTIRGLASMIVDSNRQAL